jgi:hypothetical protein
MNKQRVLAELDRIIKAADQDPDAAWKQAMDVCSEYRDSRNWWGRKPSVFDLQDLEGKMRLLLGRMSR